MSRSATAATQNDMTTCFETFEKDRFCSFPHRHGEATGKPETRDETRGCRKIGILYETSPNFYMFDMLSNRLECHKVPRLPQFSAHLTKCHACHGICTLSPLDAALPMRLTKNTQHDTSKVLRLPRKMTMDTSKVLRLPRKMQHIFWKRRKSIVPATQNDFRRVTKHVWMSRSATPATRNETTRRLKPPKMTTSAELTIGTAIRSSRGQLRTVATVNATSSEHTPSTPRPPEWNGHSGKTQWIATFLPFRAPASSFFWLFLFSDLLSSSLLFSDSSHLCFSMWPYCRKFDLETSFGYIKEIRRPDRETDIWTMNVICVVCIYIYIYVYNHIYNMHVSMCTLYAVSNAW